MGGGNSRIRSHNEWKNDINNMLEAQKDAKWKEDMKILNDRFNDKSTAKIPIINGDFYLPSQGGFSYVTPTGWTKKGNGNTLLSNANNQSFSNFGPSNEIKQFIGFQLNEGHDVQITQTIKFPSTGVYRVTFAVASRRDTASNKPRMHPEHQIEVGIDLDGGQYYPHIIPSRNWTVIEDYFFIREEYVDKPAEFRIRSFGAKWTDSTAYIAKVSILKTNKCPYFSDSTESSDPKLMKTRTMFDPAITHFDSTGKVWDSIERGAYDKNDPKNVAKFRPVNYDTQDSKDAKFMNPYPDTKDIQVDCLNEWALKRKGYEYCNTSKTSIKKTDAKSSVFNGNSDANHLNLTNPSECIPVNPTHYDILEPKFKDPSGDCEVLGTDIEKKNQISQSLPITNVFSHNKFAFTKPKCVKINASNEVILSQCEEKDDTPIDVQLHSVRRVYTVKNPRDFYRERIAQEDDTYRIVRFEGLDGKGCMYTDQDKVKYDPKCDAPNNPSRMFRYDPSNNVFSQTIGSQTKYLTATGLMTQAHAKLQANPDNPGIVGDIPMTMADCTTGVTCNNIALNTVDLFNDENTINIGDQMYRFATDSDINPNVVEPTAYINLLNKYEDFVQTKKREYEEQKKRATADLQTAIGLQMFEQEKEGKIRNQNQYVLGESYHKILQQTESIRKSGIKETSKGQTDKKKTDYKMEHQKSGHAAHQTLFIMYFVTMGLFLVALFLKTEVTVSWIPIVLIVVLFPFWVLFIEYVLVYLFYYIYYFVKGSPSYNAPFNYLFVPAFFYYIYYTLIGKPILHEEINKDYYIAFQSHGIIPFY